MKKIYLLILFCAASIISVAQLKVEHYLPSTVIKAYLCIYDLQGKQLKQIYVTDRGEGVQSISASEFTPGIYLYGLIADGYQVDMKRMILTE